MAHLGGGAEAHARFKQYEYRANSSLVLTTDTRPRDTHEPTGEPESLWGKIDPRTFGDRVDHTKPQELLERKAKAAKRKENRDKEDDLLRPSKRSRGTQEESVLSLQEEGTYRPKTKETRAAYEMLLSTIQLQFGDQPQDVLRGAADEVLAVLKNDKLKDLEKKRELEKLLNTLSQERFNELISTGKMIVDYYDGGDATTVVSGAGEALDDNIGVAVEFEEDEDEEGSDVGEVLEESENEEDGQETNETAGMQMGGIDDDEMEEAEQGLNVQDIDAYWLQRKITQAYGEIEPQQSQKLAEQVLQTLGEGDDRDVENKLVMLLNYDKFDLIKLLLKNRLKIVWCTRLARSQDDDERRKIEQKMDDGGPLAAILEQLHATRATAKERQKNLEGKIRQEARKLRDDGGKGMKSSERDVISEGWWQKGQRQFLDLKDLAFEKEGLFMANKRIELPEKTVRATKKGYEEIHVPALKPKPMSDGEKLVQISDMPSWAQLAFKEMKSLNRVQSKVYDTALFNPHNILLCAPTGAGKTNVAILTMLREIVLRRRDDGTYDLRDLKIVYIAPMKALVAEVVGNLQKRLEDYGVKVKELSGDQSLSRKEIEETHVIVATPEKWDIITRKSGDRTYTQLVRLLIVDEIHLLHDGRGPVLESIVARTVRQVEVSKEMIRLVGLSATLPNYLDVALFLRVDKDKGLFHFDNSYRPVPLAQQYIGITVKKPLQRFQLMNEICYEKVLQGAGKFQILIFVHSRKETAKTSRAIRDAALANDTLGLFLKADSASREILQTEVDNVKNTDLKDLLSYGFAIHHAGMNRKDRTLVEELFADGHIQVLVSTATLAWGVNLPAHTVIIKGTQVYNPEKGAWTELSPMNVMQMLGRAGRPQFDSSGEGIIITGHTELSYYLSLMNQQLPIESQFVSRLPDNLNAEIVLGNVQNAREACSWLGYTYLYIRMLRNPVLYGVSPDVLETDKELEGRRADLIHTAATILDKNNLIKYDRRTGQFKETDLGRIASHYYITHGTMAIYNEQLKPTTGEIELCRTFSHSEEFKNVGVREEEKLELAKLLEKVPIPVKEPLDDPMAKINVLLQAYISHFKLEGFSLFSDMTFITQNAGRLMRALFEIVLKRGWAQLAEKALNLCKMVERRMWSTQTPLRQFKGIPNDVLSKIERKDFTWDQYYDMSAHELGELVKFSKLGKTLHKCIHTFPKLDLSATTQPITRTVLKVDLTITPDFQWDENVNGYVEPFWVIVEDHDGENILHHEYFLLKMQYVEEDHTLSFTVPIFEPVPPQYFIRVVSDRWLKSETVLPVSFRHLHRPEKNPPPTELLDLQPLPVSALREPAFEALYLGFKHFNPVQTQVFSVLYNSDDNVLVAAPTGSGKTICGEFAILHMLQKHADSGGGKCVYVAPKEALATERFQDWSRKFGEGLDLEVVELTGEPNLDWKLLEKGQIVISTPERWDILSRRWRQKKQIQEVNLFLVDELHLIGGEEGPVLEVVVSRMRHISVKHAENRIRIVALSSSLANAKDMADWIGASSNGLFNFSANVGRPVTLDIHIQGMDITNFDARMQAMTKSTFTSIMQHAKAGKPALVFVPTRTHVRTTAADLFMLVAWEKATFLQCTEGDLEPWLSRVRDRDLIETLKGGVGYLHEGLSMSDRQIVEQLFTAGAIQVCVASSSLCWGMTLTAHLVIVMGTQYYDGRENGHTDYPIADLLQMIGRACRPLVDTSGKCIIFCHTPRKQYYMKFLNEPLPVESHLDHFLHDHINAEIVTTTIENKQDAVDYLTWTLWYRRLTQNPNYYNLHGTGHNHLSDHLSDLVESTLSDLEASKCISIEEDTDVSALNLGLIASYYYIRYTTIELFSNSLTAKTKLKGLLEILSTATEYADLPIRPGEEEMVRKLVNHQRYSVERPKFSDPHLKANALLQAHFSRHHLSGNLAQDQREVLVKSIKLLQAMVDVIASNSWLNPALLTMDICQMVTQGQWERDSSLLQLPHFTRELANRCKERSIDTIYELMAMEDSDRRELLQMNDSQLMDIASVCNRFPNIDITHEVVDANEATVGETVTIQVMLERELGEDEEVGPVHAPRFPTTREEGWWVLIGDTSTNSLMAIKRITIQRQAKCKLEIQPQEAGRKEYKLYVVCDAYLGCDQEYDVVIDVKDSNAMDE